MTDFLQPKESIMKEGDVICFRLITGDEIIGKITKLTRDEVFLKKPCTVVAGPKGAGLAPATILGDPEHPVIYQRSAIVATMKPRTDAESAYTSMETGLQVPANPGLVMPTR